MRSLDPDELRRALSAAAAEFIREVVQTRPEIAERLRSLLRHVSTT